MSEVDDLIAELDGVLTEDKARSVRRSVATKDAKPAAKPPRSYIKDEDLTSTDDLDKLLDSLGGDSKPGTRSSVGRPVASGTDSGRLSSFDRKMQSYTSSSSVPRVNDEAASVRSTPISTGAPMNSFERKMMMQNSTASGGESTLASRQPLQNNIRPSAVSKSNSLPTHSKGNVKCKPAYFGGGSVPMGHSSGFGDPMSCDRLRCSACDFRVVFIENGEWSDKVDYLFLRNNTPDVDKLSRQIIKTRGSRAFCCQCSWKSISESSILDIAKEGNINGKGKWFCSGH